MKKRASHLLVALILLVSLSSAQAQLFSSPALQVPFAILDATIKLLRFLSNVVKTLILMFCNIGNNDPSVKTAYYSLMIHRPNENVTSCVIGCLAGAAYNMQQAFTNLTRIDPFFLVRRIVGESNYQEIQHCAEKVQDDKCAMSFLFLDCVVNLFYSKFKKDLHDFQDGVRRIVNGFPHLMQEFIARDGIPGGYFDIAMGLPTLIPRLLNFTTPPPYETGTSAIISTTTSSSSTTSTTMRPTPTDSFSTNQRYQIHILTESPTISYPFAYSKQPSDLNGISPN